MAPRPQPKAGPDRPNIVVVLADDLDVTSMRYLPGLRRQTVDAGTSFTRAFVTDSLCCPSRTSILRGQYVHNHGVVDNTEPDGGYVRFADRGLGRSTIGTWMHDAGYRTSFMGKFLNAYPQPQHPTRAL
ncbi:MAG: sulfatase-like hydrolase/transferase, partial [Actinomycetes bacterium]